MAMMSALPFLAISVRSRPLQFPEKTISFANLVEIEPPETTKLLQHMLAIGCSYKRQAIIDVDCGYTSSMTRRYRRRPLGIKQLRSKVKAI